MEVARIVSEYRQKPYQFWETQIGGEPITFELTTEKGRFYQVEIESIWDGDPRADIRVLFNIDDGGWRAYFPLTDGFIIARDGQFVGE